MISYPCYVINCYCFFLPDPEGMLEQLSASEVSATPSLSGSKANPHSFLGANIAVSRDPIWKENYLLLLVAWASKNWQENEKNHPEKILGSEISKTF